MELGEISFLCRPVVQTTAILLQAATSDYNSLHTTNCFIQSLLFPDPQLLRFNELCYLSAACFTFELFNFFGLDAL